MIDFINEFKVPKSLVRLKANKQSNTNSAQRFVTKVYISYHLTNLVGMRRELAEKYNIIGSYTEKICEQNASIASQMKRYDIVKVYTSFKNTYN